MVSREELLRKKDIFTFELNKCFEVEEYSMRDRIIEQLSGVNVQLEEGRDEY